MKFRDGAELAGGAASESGLHEPTAGREHYGSRADGQHHAVWHVHVTGEPDGGSSDIGRNGRADADAVHTEHAVTVGAGRTDGAAGESPTLDNSSQLMCVWGGLITFAMPGEMTVEVA